MSLTAHHLESVGIPTVIIGSARDIVEEAGVPRFVFTDFPLGNPYGAPGDSETQVGVLELALSTLEGAFAPRTTVHAPYVWEGASASVDDAWRDSFMFVSDDNRDALLAAGERRRKKQATDKD